MRSKAAKSLLIALSITIGLAIAFVSYRGTQLVTGRIVCNQPAGVGQAIAWTEATGLVQGGRVITIMAAHSNAVYICLQDGSRFTSMMPANLDIFTVVRDAPNARWIEVSIE